ncbi:MAG TPA: DNA polymerase I [Humisphaera sp.]|jgi:DNA polymerase-1|nr:DNA polymerase I [Humisphaera sp.]
MPKSFYIIDGHAQIYRAYFAPFRDLSTASGEPTKATFVFLQMLMNLISQRKPDYLCMVIDAGDETVFRREFFPEYKANRQSPPDDFYPQEKRILQIVRDSGLPVFARPGYEADDLIATMAKKLAGEYEIFMVSKDKDLRQIISDTTKMYDVQSDEVIDVAALEQKHGYTPAEAIEIQTLCGDSTDNVPGIPGVGDKTALKLVKKYGSADAVLKHLDELTPKMRENFEKFGDRLPISRRLVTLKDDVEFDFDPEVCRFTGLNTDVLRHAMETLGFTSLLNRLPASDKAAKVVVPSRPSSPLLFQDTLFPDAGGTNDGPTLSTGADCKYTLVHTDEQFADFLQQLKKQRRFAFDTETDHLAAVTAKLVGMSFSWEAGSGYYTPVCGPSGTTVLDCQRALAALKPILEDPKIEKVGHNIKYDTLVMDHAGIHMRGIALDSMIGAWLVDPSRLQYGIDRLALDMLRFKKVPTTDLLGKGKTQITMDRVELNRITCYAAEDADITWRLSQIVDRKLEEVPALRKLNDELETPLIEVLAEMERNGVAIDPAVLKEQSLVLGAKIEELRDKIYAQAGGEFNIDSPKQLSDVLHIKLGLKVIKKTSTGQASTDSEVLDKLAVEHELPRLVQDYRELVKLKNTYVDNLTDYVNPTTGRIHASFNQAGTETGRLSCSDPNLQNIPIRTDEGRRIRLAFVPGNPQKDVLLTADYSQIELRVLAHFTQEPALVEAFARDEDIHRAVAAQVFSVEPEKVTSEQRRYAKIVNFGIIYGVSPMGLARRIEGLTIKAARDLIIAYNKQFPSIAHFLRKCVGEAQQQGYVQTILGRRRPIPDINSAVLRQRNASERMAINSVVQGSAADLIKVAMLNIYRKLKKDKHPSRLVMQVHDELVFETPIEAVETEAAMVREQMQSAMQLRVPLKVEIGWGKNWQEVK